MFSRSATSAKAPPHVSTFGDVEEVTAVLTTSLGKITCRLFAKKCPMTVGNFVALARGEAEWKTPAGETTRKPLYDGTRFHRVIPDFMIQGGDPAGSGMGGPGYKFGDEFDASLTHAKPGMLSMANSGPNTNGSQFFITVAPTSWLDNRHTVFGEVTDGMDIVTQIANAATGGQDRPKQDIILEKVEIQA